MLCSVSSTSPSSVSMRRTGSDSGGTTLPASARLGGPRSPDPSTLGLEGDMVGLTGLLNMKSPLSVLASDIDANLNVRTRSGLAAKTPRRSLLSALATARDSPIAPIGHGGNDDNVDNQDDDDDDGMDLHDSHCDPDSPDCSAIRSPHGLSELTSGRFIPSEEDASAPASSRSPMAAPTRARPFVRTSTASGRLETLGVALNLFETPEIESPSALSPEPLPRALFFSQPHRQQRQSSPDDLLSFQLPCESIQLSSPRSEDSLTLFDFAKDDSLVEDSIRDAGVECENCVCEVGQHKADGSSLLQQSIHRHQHRSHHHQHVHHQKQQQRQHHRQSQQQVQQHRCVGTANVSLLSNTSVHSNTTGACSSFTLESPASPTVFSLSLSCCSPPKRGLGHRLARHASLPAFNAESVSTSSVDLTVSTLRVSNQHTDTTVTTFLDQNGVDETTWMRTTDYGGKPPLAAVFSRDVVSGLPPTAPRILVSSVSAMGDGDGCGVGDTVCMGDVVDAVEVVQSVPVTTSSSLLTTGGVGGVKSQRRAGLFSQRGVLHWNQQQQQQNPTHQPSLSSTQQRRKRVAAPTALHIDGLRTVSRKPPRIPVSGSALGSLVGMGVKKRDGAHASEVDTHTHTQPQSETESDTRCDGDGGLVTWVSRRHLVRPLSPMQMDIDYPVVTTSCRSNDVGSVTMESKTETTVMGTGMMPPPWPRSRDHGVDQSRPHPGPPHKMRRSNTIPVSGFGGHQYDGSSCSGVGGASTASATRGGVGCDSDGAGTDTVKSTAHSDPYVHEEILPSTLNRNKDMIRRITVDTLEKVLDGHYDDAIDEFHLIDCRYAYEYAGGHISSARNITQPDVLEEVFFRQLPVPSRRVVIVFHCEYSVQRAPQMALHFRSVDRNMNAMMYPRLHYPHIYVLSGGYREFFAGCRDKCTPCGYVAMNDEAHGDEYKKCLAMHRRQFRKSFSDGFLR